MPDIYEQFKAKVYKKTSINLSSYKETQMKRRITSLASRNGFNDLLEYFNMIDKNKEKFDEFIDELNANDYLENYIKKVLEIEEIESDRPLYLSLLLTDNEKIQVINRDFRSKDAPTDVISFAYHETEDFNIGPYDTLGDIIISLERVEEQAKEYNHSFKREFYYVLTHGILHILGYDHIEEEDKKIMREREEIILSSFGYTRDN